MEAEIVLSPSASVLSHPKMAGRRVLKQIGEISIASDFTDGLSLKTPAESSSEVSLTNEDSNRDSTKHFSFKFLDLPAENWIGHSGTESAECRTPLDHSSPPVTTPEQSLTEKEFPHPPVSSPRIPTRNSNPRTFKSRVTPRPRRQTASLANLSESDHLIFPITDLALVTLPKQESVPSDICTPVWKEISIEVEDGAIGSDEELDDLYIQNHAVRELLERKLYTNPHFTIEKVAKMTDKVQKNIATYSVHIEHKTWEDLSDLAGWQAPRTQFKRKPPTQHNMMDSSADPDEFSPPKRQRRKLRPACPAPAVKCPVDWFGYQPHPALEHLRWTAERRPLPLDPITQRPRLILYLRKRQ